ncbi:hypothetical protein B0H11DRAFT_1766922 [Mycena galericulata]|nr:hypothetical protein B0H11DRAFT_1766922 [Mycena galericulata]
MLRELGRTDSVISGSSLVPILTGADFTPNDLHVYVPKAKESQMLLAIEGMGFTNQRTEARTYSNITGIIRVHWLTKADHIINIVVVDGENALIAILYFHSTIVMNFLSTHGLFCIYPDLTLYRLSIFSNMTMLDNFTREKHEDCFAKYTQRSIIFAPSLRNFPEWSTHTCGQDPSCPHTIRSLHDGNGLFIPLVSHLESPQTVHNVPLRMLYDGFTSVVWSLGGTACSEEDVLMDTFVISVPI